MSEQVRDVLNRLEAPIADCPTLLGLLSSVLASIGLLPPKYSRYIKDAIPSGSLNIQRHIPRLQETILTKIIPTWEDALREHDGLDLVEQYFCPDAFLNASPAAGDLTLLAYATILGLPLSDYAVGLLVRLVQAYPIDRLYTSVLLSRANASQEEQQLAWEDCVRLVVAVPAKVANALGVQRKAVPALLEHGAYFNGISVRCEVLMHRLALGTEGASEGEIAAVTFLLTKLANQGVFPSSPPVVPSQPSFFVSTLPVLRQRLAGEHSAAYSTFWVDVFDNLSSFFTSQTILTSLMSSLFMDSRAGSDYTGMTRSVIKREALFLRRIIGDLSADRSELWNLLSAIMLRHEWSPAHGRTLVCWAAADENALAVLLQRIMEIWASPDHIKHSLLSQHQYLTSLLLITVSYFQPSSPHVQALAISPNFISGIGVYVGHLDQGVRRCGMLAAEIVAQRTGRTLDFGDWEGEGSGKAWARQLRALLAVRGIDATDDPEVEPERPLERQEGKVDARTEALPPTTKITVLPSSDGYDSDDSLTGYASQASSRSASPTPEELAEIEKDPSLNIGIKKVTKPVYLAQLGSLVRNTGGQKSAEDPDEADKVEMALNCAEELIRKKRDFGTELEENAVNLVYGFVTLQDNYELEGFDQKRQAALNALVCCCPRKAAPSLIEEFFKNQYSTNQRFAILSALALGARELASLPLPPGSRSIDPERVSFPSKRLPGPLHNRYLDQGGQTQVAQITQQLSRAAIEKDKADAGAKIPEIARERMLRIRKPAKIAEVAASAATQPYRSTARLSSSLTYTEVATECFIAPLIHRFWSFLRDEQTREGRTAHLEGRQQYHGAGTGLILNPLVLSHFLGTVAVLVHAAQNAPEWLAVIAPEALELAVTVGTRPVSRMEDDDDGFSEELGQNPDHPRGKQAAVLTASLELALIVLDGCMDVDGGRSLGLEHTTLLLGAGEWAGSMVARLENGLKVEGGGGSQEVRLRRAAAGVLLKVDELASKWRRSMIDMIDIL